MASLVDLPVELLDMVLSGSTISEVSKLSRTCKTLELQLRPHVFRNVSWDWEEDEPCPPLVPLLRAFCLNPNLATMVKSLTLRGWGTYREDVWIRCAYPGHSQSLDDPCVLKFCDVHHLEEIKADRNMLQQVKNIVDNIYRPSPKLWIQEYKRGNTSTLAALILSQLSSLETLDIGLGWLHCPAFSRFIPAMLHHQIAVVGSNRRFPHLATVRLAADAPTNTAYVHADLDGFRSFFYATRVKTIDAVFMEPVIFAWPSSSLEPRLVTLTTLTLRRSTASEKTLERILRCTPQLTRLVYDRWIATDLGPPHWGDYAPECRNVSRWPCTLCTDKVAMKNRQFSCRLLDDALVHVRETLQSLVIKVKFKRRQRAELKLLHCAVIGRSRMVRSMNKLSHLEIPWVVLLGREASSPPFHDLHDAPDTLTHRWAMALPGSIQNLRLRNDTSNLAHYTYDTPATQTLIEALLAARASQFPNLTKLDMFYMFDRRQNQRITRAIHENLGPFMAFIRSLCNTAGLSCQFTFEKWTENQVLYEVVE